MNTRREFLGRVGAAALVPSFAILPESHTSAISTSNDSAHTIIDTHQHLWDLRKQQLPWLADAPAILNKTYYQAEYRQATKGLNIKAIYMEVAIDPSQLVEEAEQVIGLSRDPAKETIAAVIGGRPESESFSNYIEPYKSIAEVKGVRRILHETSTGPGYCLQKEFIKNVQWLGEAGLRFDLCMRPTDLNDGAKLAALCPNTRFILDHCGNGNPRAFKSFPGVDEKPPHTPDEWKRGIENLAKLPNVMCKISGVVASLPKGGDADDLAPVVYFCLDAFGPDRVVFGTDWPVCLLGAPLLTWVEMLRQIIRTRPADDQQKLWSSNAIRFYGL